MYNYFVDKFVCNKLITTGAQLAAAAQNRCSHNIIMMCALAAVTDAATVLLNESDCISYTRGRRDDVLHLHLRAHMHLTRLTLDLN